MNEPIPDQPARPFLFLTAAVGSFGVAVAVSCWCVYFWFFSASSSGLNLDDFEATKLWARNTSRHLKGIRDNQIGLKDAIESIEKKGNKNVGEKVRWQIPLLVVESDPPLVGPTRDYAEWWPAKEGDDIYFSLRSERPKNIPADWFFDMFALNVGPDITHERAARLRPGVPFLVTGTIREITVVHDRQIRIVLGDLKGE